MDAFPSVRLVAYGYTLSFYLICLLVFNSGSMCSSQAFAYKQNVIVFLCVICMVIVAAAWGLETLAKRGKIDRFIQRRLKRRDRAPTGTTASLSYALQSNPSVSLPQSSDT